MEESTQQAPKEEAGLGFEACLGLGLSVQGFRVEGLSFRV